MRKLVIVPAFNEAASLPTVLHALGEHAFSSTLRWVARAVSITVPSNALFALSFVYVLLNLLAATIAISANATKVRRLAQEAALLRAELDALRARVDSVAGGR